MEKLYGEFKMCIIKRNEVYKWLHQRFYTSLELIDQ